MSTAQSLRLQVILGAVDTLTKPLRSMLDSSHGLSRAVKETRDRLRDLETQQKRLDGFRKSADDIQATARALDAARAKVRDLRGEIIASDRPHKNLTDSYRAAQKEVRQLERQQTALARAHETARVNVERMGVPVGQLAARQRQLAGDIDQANAALTRHGQRLAHVRERQREWNRAMEVRGKLLNAGTSMVAAGAAMGLPVVAAVKNFSTLEDAMLGVAKQVEGARDENGKLTQTYYDMLRAIEDMSTRIPMSVTDLAALAAAGARMGVQGKDALLEYIETAANASTAFDAPAEQIGESIARISDLYKRGFGEIGDTINFLDDKTQAKGADIIDVLTRIAGITQTVKMSFKDSAALGTTFLNLGASAEIAATASNAVIRELSIAAMQPAKFQDGLKAIGLSAEGVQSAMSSNATGTILQVLEAIRQLPDERKLTVATQLFGKEYGDDVSKLAVNIDKYRQSLAMANDEEARNSMEREAAARSSNLSAYWQLTLNRLFLTSAKGGSTLKDSLISVMDSIGGMLDGIRNFMDENPGFTSAIMHIAGISAGLALTVGGLALGIGAMYLPLRIVAGALKLLAGAALAHPIVALIATIAAGALLVWQNWETIGPWLKGLWDSIKAIFKSGVDYVMEKIEKIKAAMSFDFNQVMSFGKGPTAQPLRAASSGPAVVTNNTPVTVNAAPGQSPQDVGREVARQLDERERYRLARRRSILGDVD